MKNKLVISVLLVILLLTPFAFSDRSDTINPTSLSDSTIGFYQSSTCNISLLEFYFQNRNTNIYFNANDYADIRCFGKVTGVDKTTDSYMVSIGTNTSINLLLQSSLWFLLLLFIPKIKSENKFSIRFLFVIPILLTLQYFGENKFYTKTNILHSIDLSIKNYYLIALFIFYSLCCIILFDIFKDRYLNLINYLPFIFLIVGTYSGMNLNIYLIIGSFFGIQSLVIDKKLKIPDFLYFFFSIFWIFSTNVNEYFFDGDKLRGFSNSSYNITSQIFWIFIFYFFLKGILFLIRESKDYFNIEKFIQNLLITSSLVLTFGILGSMSSIINFFNFYIFGQNKRGMKTFESIAGNTWRGFSASAESIGEFYAFTILIFIFCVIYKKINYVDGYKINLKNIENKKSKNNKFLKGNITKNNLWFVNIGGYDPKSMQEKHEFGLVVAKSSLEAKNTAKSKWLNGYKKKHKDDISALKNLITLDDCELIDKIGNWEIELILENNFVEETNSPDWFGYLRIDQIV